MRVYKYNKNGIKIIVKVDVPQVVSDDPSYLNKSMDFEYLGDPYDLYTDKKGYDYPSLLTYLNYDLFDISLTFDMH